MHTSIVFDTADLSLSRSQSLLKLLEFAMGKAQSKECESEELREAKRLMEEEGIVGVQASIRKKLQSWEDVEIKFCVTGNSGVGKSSFINAFRGYGSLLMFVLD